MIERKTSGRGGEVSKLENECIPKPKAFFPRSLNPKLAKLLVMKTGVLWEVTSLG